MDEKCNIDICANCADNDGECCPVLLAMCVLPDDELKGLDLPKECKRFLEQIVMSQDEIEP